VSVAAAALLLLWQPAGAYDQPGCEVVLCGTRIARPADPTRVLPLAGEQGGLIRGAVAPGSRVSIDGKPVPVAPDGRLVLGLDRDQGREARLVITMPDGTAREHRIEVAPRSWRIEHVNAARRPGGPTEEFRRRREGELELIRAARAIQRDSAGWAQDFIWPARGRISGRFGSQRIYRGEPGSYHAGVDVAAGAGAPVVAPADGVVVLAASEPFSLEGNLLIVDHGHGLNSAFLHLSRLDVRVGERVRQGQAIGAVGATGRATGPHLHWALTWNGARLDPERVAGPMR
jgi:hypothetical protein